MCNTYTYTDKVASLVQEAAYLQANPSSQEGDAVSIPVSHIDGKHLNIDQVVFSIITLFVKLYIFVCSDN